MIPTKMRQKKLLLYFVYIIIILHFTPQHLCSQNIFNFIFFSNDFHTIENKSNNILQLNPVQLLNYKNPILSNHYSFEDLYREKENNLKEVICHWICLLQKPILRANEPFATSVSYSTIAICRFMELDY